MRQQTGSCDSHGPVSFVSFHYSTRVALKCSMRQTYCSCLFDKICIITVMSIYCKVYFHVHAIFWYAMMHVWFNKHVSTTRCIKKFIKVYLLCLTYRCWLQHFQLDILKIAMRLSSWHYVSPSGETYRFTLVCFQSAAAWVVAAVLDKTPEKVFCPGLSSLHI